jgi:hypothetical protein
VVADPSAGGVGGHSAADDQVAVVRHFAASFSCADGAVPL